MPNTLANNNTLCLSGMFYQVILCQLYQLNFLYYSYQRSNKKKIYQIDNKILENLPKGFYIVFEAKREEINYLNKGFNKVVINFIGIETTYIKCNIFFSLKFKLYKYLKTGCIKTVQILPIFNIKFKIISQFLELALAFQR